MNRFNSLVDVQHFCEQNYIKRKKKNNQFTTIRNNYNNMKYF